MIKLNKEEILAIYDLIIEITGGRKGIRDCGLLDSAINSAYQTFDNIEIYPSIEEKAARTGYGLISNHAFIDGNKRIGVLVMLTILDINGINLKYSDDDLINIGLSVASGNAGYYDLLEWINTHKEKTKECDVELSK